MAEAGTSMVAQLELIQWPIIAHPSEQSAVLPSSTDYLSCWNKRRMGTNIGYGWYSQRRCCSTGRRAHPYIVHYANLAEFRVTTKKEFRYSPVLEGDVAI